MKTEQETAPIRRRQRITAMRNGKEIPHPELAGADARPGNQDDRDVLAMLAGQAKRLSVFPPAQLLTNETFAANEIFAIGPTVRFKLA